MKSRTSKNRQLAKSPLRGSSSREPPPEAFFPTGNLVSNPRARAFASRNPLLVPRDQRQFPYQAGQIRQRLLDPLGIRARAAAQLRRPIARKTSPPVRRVAISTTPRPPMPPRRDACQRRSQRAEVMHAKGIAGSSWGRKGPNMNGAVRTALSNYTCRR